MAYDYSNKVIVITGGAGGIGISNPISGTGIAMIGGGGTTVNNCGLGGSGAVIIKY